MVGWPTYTPPRVTFDPADIIGPNGPIARRLGAAYEERPQQREMIHAVQTALEGRHALMVEAGTGVGKSFSYLLPAVAQVLGGPRADEPADDPADDGVRMPATRPPANGGSPSVHGSEADKRRRVIISTHTIALQEQICEKDIPLLQAVLPGAGGDEFSAVLVKGRGNYVSRRRMGRAWERKASLFDDSAEQRTMRQLLEWINDENADGSKASLPQLESPNVWNEVQSDSEDCLGKRCPTYNECFYQSARRRMMNADLLIVNHALFFADLALKSESGGAYGVLPPYDAVVLDEAHTIEDVASDYFGLSLSRFQVTYLVSRLYHARRNKGLLATLQRKLDAPLFNQAVHAIEKVFHAGQGFFDDWEVWFESKGGSNGRVREAHAVKDSLSEPLAELSLVLKRVKGAIDGEDDRMEVQSHADRAQAMGQAVKALVGQTVPDSVYWVDVSRRGRFTRVKLNSAPVDVGQLMRTRLFEAKAGDGKALPVVMTSATLTTGGEGDRGDGFEHLKQRLGCPEAHTLRLGSPFDYRGQVQLVTHAGLPDPGDPRHFDAMTPTLLEHLDASDGGAFVLFTSYAMLQRTAEWLRPRLARRNMPMLVHGDGEGRSAMLERFKQDHRSVLLGTDSFWQGVDVRGDALRLVVITRLPFVVPDRPMVQARSERITDRGGNAFRDYSLPEAVLKFKQGFGRLVRSKTDRGAVVVMDPRLVTKFYGRQFVAALPDVTVVAGAGPQSQ